MPYDEADEAIDELFEADEASDEGFDEAARSWSRRPKVASGRSAFSPRPQSQYVTQTQLQTALAKVGSQISTNSAAISKVSGQVSQVMSALKKEAADRKKDSAALKNNLSQTQQIAAILPLLTQAPSIGPTSGLSADGIPDGTKLLSGGGSTLSLLLPLLLLTGIGDGSGGTGGLFGSSSDNSSLMMLVLVLALSGRSN